MRCNLPKARLSQKAWEIVIKVLTIDPGGTTGYCRAVIGEPKRLYLTCEQARLDHRAMWKLALGPYTHVICESFAYRNKSREGLNLMPVELIGVVKLACSSRPEILTMQSPAQGKSVTDQRLKNLGLYVPGKQHGRDAIRHFLHWFTMGGGFKYNDDPVLTLVEPDWIGNAYF